MNGAQAVPIADLLAVAPISESLKQSIAKGWESFSPRKKEKVQELLELGKDYQKNLLTQLIYKNPHLVGDWKQQQRHHHLKKITQQKNQEHQQAEISAENLLNNLD